MIYSGSPQSTSRLRDDEISMVALLGALLRHLPTIFWTSAIVAAVAVAIYLTSEPRYTATSSFLPQTATQGTSRYSDLAAQIGISLGGTNSGESPAFYATLLTSPTLLEQTARSTFELRPEAPGRPPIRATLVELYGLEGETEQQRVIRTVRALEERVTVEQEIDAGTVILNTTANRPDLAEQINRRMLSLVSEFNVERRQSQAAAERRFTEARLEQARRELTESEAALQRFLENNRTYLSSPQLSIERQRLQRRVDLNQQVFNSLAQAYEQARIDEVRNTPVITLIDDPEGSAARQNRLILTVLFGLIIGGFVSSVIVVIAEYLRRLRAESPEDFKHLDGLRRSAVVRIIPRPIRELGVFRQRPAPEVDREKAGSA